jgi:calcium/calmodulin-dependent protein kinase I
MAARFFSEFSLKVKKVLPRKKKIEDSYEIKNELGSGHYSIVKRGVHKKTGEEVALKIIEKELLSEFEKEHLSTEIEILKIYGTHPNIITLRDVYEDRKRLVLVMDCMRGGDLLQHIKKKKYFSEKEASSIIKKVIKAIAYLHKNGIVHRDIKPDNLLFTSEDDNAEVKIADFGFARYIGDAGLREPCGSPAYVAPEIVNEENYNKAVDMWSVGVTLYILLCGFPPFYDEIMEKLFVQIKEGRYDFPDPYWTKVSASAKELISSMLKVNPKERITAEDALAHPWIKGLTASGEQQLEIIADSDELKVRMDKINEVRRSQEDPALIKRRKSSRHRRKEERTTKKERPRHKDNAEENKSKEEMEDNTSEKTSKHSKFRRDRSDSTTSSSVTCEEQEWSLE